MTISSQSPTIAIGFRVQSGPYGGGNQFASSLQHYLQARGWRVVFDLNHPAIDVILVTEVRSWLGVCAFDMAAARAYVAQHPNCRVVLRVNECDERKGATFKLLNNLIAHSARAANHTVFISAWLRDLFLKREPGLAGRSSVIHNGADEAVFNRAGFVPWSGQGPLRVVTHHWSDHHYKGWDIYRQLDRIVGEKQMLVHFTYIGNVPADVRLSHSMVLAPMAGQALARELKRHHAYVTASLHEPAGMHHVEAAACGLPILYRMSGALPEYCRDFGVPFYSQDDFPSALQTLLKQYGAVAPRLLNYPYRASLMCQRYEERLRQVLQQPLQAGGVGGLSLAPARFLLRGRDQLRQLLR